MDSASGYASPRRSGFQDFQQQRQEDFEATNFQQQRRSRGSYMASHETDFLMASLFNSPDPVVAAVDTTCTTSETPRRQDTGSGRQSPLSLSFQNNGIFLEAANRRSASSVINVRQQAEALTAYLEELPSLDPAYQQQATAESTCSNQDENENKTGTHYGACDTDNNNRDREDSMHMFQEMKHGRKKSAKHHRSLLEQIPAIAIASLLNLMMAIPFGVSYFPIGWAAHGGSSTSAAADDADGVSGSFPLPGKEALGIRMCLFSTLVGQIVMTFASKFDSAICFQMIENVPFFHTLATIVIASQGYGMDSLSTLFFIFGLSSIIVGLFFYLLGRFDLGRVVYFFPTHVLVGCIGGIGVFITISAIEVTNGVSFSWDLDGLKGIIDNLHLLGVVLLFEATLRILAWKTNSRVPLLAPIFFCSIPFVFYAGLWLFRVDLGTAKEAGFFFPAPTDDGGDDESSQNIWSRAFSVHTIDLLRVVDFRTISWKAVYDSIGTMVALAAFSLIHVPINIPAFSISMDLDTDMNAELIAHGYSNFAAGLFGGLPNYMTYSNSLLYAKSNGGGKAGSLLVAFFTFVFFIFGPEFATFIPRCMAGTLLLHVGLDLFLEGVVDSYHNYDWIEYAGIWLITVTMTALGMTAGLIAGVFAALSVYAAQSITYINPIREIMSADTLRSSVWTRPASELAILNDDHTGRSRIMVVLLQGHLFFGNVTQLTETIKRMLSEKQGTDLEPLIVILDFSLVLGLDSSAAHSVAKMNATMHRRFSVAATVFVAGREGFPCQYALSEALSKHRGGGEVEELEGLASSLASIGNPNYLRNLVCDNLDEALIFAEDVLIARQNPSLLKRDQEVLEYTGYMPPEDERRLAAQQLANLFPKSDEVTSVVKLLFSYFEREEYTANQILWRQGDDSDCAKLLVRGQCVAYSAVGKNKSMAAERVPTGNIVGELGLVHGLHRLSTLECTSDTAVFYSLSLKNWEKIKKDHSFAALYFEEIVIRYLAQRVQHVTNRIFESRCLPI